MGNRWSTEKQRVLAYKIKLADPREFSSEELKRMNNLHHQNKKLTSFLEKHQISINDFEECRNATNVLERFRIKDSPPPVSPPLEPTTGFFFSF